MADRKEYELALKIVGLMDQSVGTTANLTKKQIRSIAKEAANAGRIQTDFVASMVQSSADAITEMGPGIDAAWGGLKKTVAATAEAMMAAGAGITAIGAASVGVGKEFEAAMSSWAATADASEGDYEKARAAAMEMGRSTSKTATESAQALEYMALAGWDVDDSVSGLPDILRLSEATGLDLARTSDLVTDSMSALGIEVQDLGGYLDVAAKANNKSNQTAEQLMEAYLGVGGTMKNLNIPIQESAAALGVLANRGIKGSEAGNALNAVMVNLTTGAGQAGKMMGKLGISAFDSAGKFIGLHETMRVVNTALSGLNEEERNAALAAIGGKQHVDALNDLLAGLNTTVADGVTEWENLETELYHANGALEQMAKVKLDNLEGDLAILQSALQDSGIRIYDSLQEPLREATQLGTEAVYDFSENVVEELTYMIPTIRRNMLEAKDSVEEFAGPLLRLGGWMMDNPDVIVGGLAAIGTTITSLKVAQTITSTAKAMNALRLAMMANPVTAAIGITAAAGGAIVGLGVKIKMANAELKKQNLAEHFGDIHLSLEELEDVAGQIINNGNLDKLSTAMDELGKVKEIAKNLSNSNEALDKLNWKIGMGFELSEADTGEYERQLHAYIENAIALGEQQQYAMNLNLRLLTDDDETGRGIVDQFNSFYDGLNAELRGYGEQLGEVYAEGMKDGVLSMDEVEAIQELQRKMADITAELSSSQFEAKMEAIGIKYGGGQLDAETFQNLQLEIQEQVDEASANLEESLIMNIAGAKLQLKEGAINRDEYETMIAEFRENYLEQIGEIQLKASGFQTDTLYQQYEDELAIALPMLMDHMNDVMNTYLENTQFGGNADLSFNAVMAGFSDSLSQDTRDAIRELWESMEPDLGRLEAIKEEYQAAGQEIPETLAKAISDMTAIGMIAGSEDALWSYIGAEATTNEAYQGTLQAMQEAGYALPKEIASGIGKNAGAIHSEIESLHEETDRLIRNRFSFFEVTSQLRMNFQVTHDGGDIKTPRLVKHASGGIFDEPHFGVFAEAGPEAFIPIDRTKRSVSIWEQTGRELGILGDSGKVSDSISNVDNKQTNITYSPVYHVTGIGEEAVRNAASDDYERFEQHMRRYIRTGERLNY